MYQQVTLRQMHMYVHLTLVLYLYTYSCMLNYELTQGDTLVMLHAYIMCVYNYSLFVACSHNFSICTLQAMKSYVVKNSGVKLDSNQRNLLSVAYKNIVGARRNAWRVLSSIDSKNPTDVTKEYIGIVEKELNDLCNEVIVS